MAEATMRRRVIKALKSLDAVAIESSTGKGIPDVNTIAGWVELKWLRDWPKRASTPVRLDHFTKEQRLWLRRRIFKGGRAFVLLQCKKEWLLFLGDVAANVIGESTKAELINSATLYLPVFDSAKLKGALCNSLMTKPTSLFDTGSDSPKKSTRNT